MELGFNEQILQSSRPNLFELLAQEAMHEALRPAFQYLFKVLAQSRPDVLGPLWKFSEEVYSMLEAVFQLYFVKCYDGSFSENFYSLKRVSHTNGAPLTRREKILSILCVVFIPYIKAKMDNLFSKVQEEDDTVPIRGDNSKQMAKLIFYKLYPYLSALWTEEQKKVYLIDVTCPCETEENLAKARQTKLDKYKGIKEKLEEQGYQTTLDGFVVGTLGTWDPKNDHLLPILGIGRKYGTLFKKLCCRDAIAGSYEGTKFVYRMRYLFSHSELYSPLLWLAGVRISRQLDLVEGGRDSTDTLWSRVVGHLLPLGAFVLKFLEWWYSSERSTVVKMMTSLPVPPPPQPLPPSVDGIRLPSNPQLCPLCLNRRSEPTALASSGYVFCYKCLLGYLREHRLCPVTCIPTSERQMIRLFIEPQT